MAELTPQELEELKRQREEAKELREKELKLQQEMNKLLQEQIDLEKAGSEERKKILKEKKEEIKKAEEKLKLAIENQEKTDELVKKVRELTEEYENQLELLKFIDTEADQLIKSFGGISNRAEQFAKATKSAGGPLKLVKNVGKDIMDKGKNLGGLGIALSLAAKAAKEVGKSLGTMRDIAIEPVKNAVDFDEALKKAAGRLDAFRTSGRDLQLLDPGEIEKFRQDSMALADTFRATTDEVRQLSTELFSASRQFRELKAAGDPAANSLLKTSFILQRRLNIPISQTAQLTDTLSQAFGQSAEESQGFAKSLAVLADNMGLNVNEIFAKAPGIMNQLANFNIPDLRGAILKLGAITQKTGISVDSMMGSLENFSTFEGALTAASKLNAVFGTTIDGLELMDTFNIEGPIEGFIKLREVLEQQGLQVDQLNFSQMRVLKQSIGLGAEEMRRFGEVSSEQLRSITAGATSAEEATRRLTAAQGEGETTAEMQAKTQNKLMDTLDATAKSLDNAARSLLKVAEASPLAASALSKFGGVALQVIGGVGGFILSGGNFGGALLGSTLMGGVGKALGFAAGNNFMSEGGFAMTDELGMENKYTRGNPMPMSVGNRTGNLTYLPAGSAVQSAGASSSSTQPVTINLHADGQIVATSKHQLNSNDVRRIIDEKFQGLSITRNPV